MEMRMSIRRVVTIVALAGCIGAAAAQDEKKAPAGNTGEWDEWYEEPVNKKEEPPPAGSQQPAAETQAEETKAAEPAAPPKPDAKPAEKDAGTSESALAVKKIETEIPAGIIFGKFEKESSPILLAGSVIVPSGQVLELGPGVEVYMGGDYSTITVFGQMVAKGTQKNPVIIQSANAKPNPWDWDRIYCRSLNRSIFEYCIIRHANYGVSVENGSALIRNCTFENNSLCGLVVRNSDVTIQNTTFRGGHVLAMLCDGGADVYAESLTVRNNITGIACNDKSQIRLTRGIITSNTTGIAIREKSSVSFVEADITENVTGVVALAPMKRNMYEMVYANGTDVKVVTGDEMTKVLKPPEEIKSLVLPKVKSEPKVGKDFAAGFAALKAPREPMASFIGNVSTGLKYYLPETRKHPRDIDTMTGGKATYNQNRYIGEQSDAWYAGIQPEIQVFASGRRGNADVNMLADFFGNNWVPFRKNMFNLSLAYENQSLLIGDYYENVSETIIYGRKITGFRYNGEYLDMGRGEKRLKFKLAGGESELPEDAGDRNIDLVADTVDSGQSVRQQLTYITGITVKPVHFAEIAVKGLITKDQAFKPLFRSPLTDQSAPDPIQGQTGCIEAKVGLLENALTLRGELDMGVHDTIDSAQFKDIVWYNAEILPAIDTVFTVIVSGKNYAYSLGTDYTWQGYDFSGAFTAISPEYFSAGNPYLEPDRRMVDLSTKKQFSEDLAADMSYRYERREAHRTFDFDSMTPSPVDNNTIYLNGEYTWKPQFPSMSLNYMFRFEHYNDVERYEDPSDTFNFKYAVDDMKNLIGLEAKQKFENGIEYSLKYELLHENELTFHKYFSEASLNQGDGIQNRIGGKLGAKFRKLATNTFTWQVAFKDEVRNDLQVLSYKISDRIRLDIIPRKLRLTVKGDFRRKAEEEDESDSTDTRISTETTFKGFEAEVKYTLTPKISVTGMGRWEDSYDETEQSADNYRVYVGGALLTYLF
jgi:hypothetical protein